MFFFSLLGFEFGVMWGCFSNVFGLPYKLASLLICLYIYIYIYIYRKSETNGYPTRCFMQLVQSSGVNLLSLHFYIYIYIS